MVNKLVTKIFGSRNERVLKRLWRTVERINAHEPQMQALSDAELREKTDEFRARLSEGESLDDLLPEAFAAGREAAQRVLGQRHFDVQLIGGMVLHQGKISEMATGEGKTLAATLPVYLNALTGKGVHLVTVNDYLARRDAGWMGPIYHALGLTVGAINSSGGQGPDSASYVYDPEYPGQDSFRNLRPVTRREAYAADVTYGTNNEFGFDFLRDNMAFSLDEKVQRERHFAIVDEVDSILIDEARTPLIISGPADESSDLYIKIDKLIPKLQQQVEEEGPGDYSVDEKARQVFLTEDGHQRVERLLTDAGLLNEGESLYEPQNLSLMHHLSAGLKAHALFQRDVHYVVQNDEVVIVDEFTGRTMPGRRWSEGLHQAVEAKEGVSIQSENQTLASITFQNYFRMYDKLAGMTGTADTEAFEFQQIYGLEVAVIPTHKPMIRKDLGDLVYLTKDEKYEALLEDVKDCIGRSQPVLVGTASIESSEHVSRLLNEAKIPHQILNAKHHEKEAQTITQAGKPGTVTIATNMAGRGTDIVLGGNPDPELKALEPGDEEGARRIREEWQKRHDEVVAAGGLHVIASERNESRRVDNQLRGRSGRQGDPGSSRFYLSLEDDLLRIFASERVSGIMQKMGMQHGEAIEHPWVTRAIENAQRKVEARNFEIRKHLLEFDDVANDQRQVIYDQRNELMESDDISETLDGIWHDVVNGIISQYIPPGSLDEQWDVAGLEEALEHELGLKLPIRRWLEDDHELHEESLRERIFEEAKRAYAEKEAFIGSEDMRRLEKAIMLQILDGLWKEHLAALDYLRQGIHLRGYAQKNPKQEYKREAFEMFSQMLERIKYDTVVALSRVRVRTEEDIDAVEAQRRRRSGMEFKHEEASALEAAEQAQAAAAAPAAAAAVAGGGGVSGESEAPREPYRRATRKVGRNEPCPCGSGKKYKQCHGKL